MVNNALHSHYIDIENTKIHYIDEGKGDPILFLHDMPASSYVWRNVIPHVKPLGRCIAPDFVGMGKSGKPAIAYTIDDHIYYIEQFIQKLNLQNVTLVTHGWGSIVGFDYAMRSSKNCKGFIFYEAYVHPLTLEDISLPYQEQLTMIGDIADGASFVEKIITQGSMRHLNNQEIAHYKEPFLQKGSEKPLKQHVKELPRGRNNTRADEIIASYSKKLTQSSLPKLMLYTIPGFITTMDSIVWAKKHLPQLEAIEVGEDLHYGQESNPVVMGETISVWLQGIENTRI